MAPQHLVVGIRGTQPHIVPRSFDDEETAEFSIASTLERWGLLPPWTRCESHVDLMRRGENILRAWVHVHLDDLDNRAADVPVSGLTRAIWDGLELYGPPTLTGIDVIAPTAHFGETSRLRILGSTVRDPRRRTSTDTPVVVSATNAWNATPVDWDIPTICRELELVVPPITETKFVADVESEQTSSVHPFNDPKEAALNIEVQLPRCEIDDLAWIAELTYATLAGAGVTIDAQVSVRQRRAG